MSTETTTETGLFSPQDLRQMAELGIPPQEALRQIELFRNPPPFTRVLRPCRPGDGIRRLTAEDEPALLARYGEAVRHGRVGKLVPASGAASRMFKALLSFLGGPPDAQPGPEVRAFFENLPRFAFYGELAAALAEGGHDLGACVRSGDWRVVLDCLLTETGLGYAERPKGLLLFHRYPEGPRTPFEEHLVEAAMLVRDGEGLCRLHFTVSADHEDGFRQLFAESRYYYERRFKSLFEVGFSFQKRSTDTLAVDPDNQPFRDEDGALLFRPGGHGALIDNLATLGLEGWDVALLKNIDNIVPDDRKELGVYWKRLLGGLLITLQDRISELLRRLESDSDPAVIEEASRFVAEELSRPLPDGLAASEEGPLRRFLIEALDRPLRVCGMVKNEGEPGGGPFWVEGAEPGQVSIQIVETSQIDPDSPEQQAHLKASTHFSPVDIACFLRDRDGRPYDLHTFVDPSTVFISSKSHDGRPLKALERPGLWNGAMAGWNTVFVEVPVETFAPVKTVMDLLRPEHQPG
ncbi:MAG TPA: DUF4301 family protein [Thermoanaerobaculia bacterium]|nr:DUF4301 family protein [Thermoanaerobaculia bacterium]